MMSWIYVETGKDIETLMDTFGYFHDSCLKEFYYWSDNYVDDKLSMYMGWSTCVRMLFQRQKNAPSVLEMEFHKVKNIHITPAMQDYSSEIFCATMKMQEGVTYWADMENWDKSADLDCTWISAEKVRWRIKDDGFLGEDKVYFKE